MKAKDQPGECTPGQEPRSPSRPLKSGAKPAALAPLIENIPDELVVLPCWMNWIALPDGDRWTKRPVNPATGRVAPHDQPWARGTFRQAWARCRSPHGGVDGLGVVIPPGFVGIDLDKCVDPATGEVAAWAAQIVRGLCSYTELSPGGTGLHVVARAVVAGGRRRDGVEVYGGDGPARFFTVTGHRLPSPRVEARQEAVEALWATLEPPAREVATGAVAGPSSGVTGDDAALLERARAAGSGAKFRALYDEGDAGLYGGDRSRADLALCDMLAYWTGGDAARVDRLFRGSALMRPKWDERHGERTYGEMTALKACAGRGGR